MVLKKLNVKTLFIFMMGVLQMTAIILPFMMVMDLLEKKQATVLRTFSLIILKKITKKSKL